MRVVSYQSLSGREISRETVEQLLRDILREEAKKTVTIDQIQKKVAGHFDVRLADMTSKRRSANIAFLGLENLKIEIEKIQKRR